MIGLRIENQRDMVFSATPASEGDHATLGYIPGQVLWGALAARVYGSARPRSQAFELVHAGGIRVSPGFPMAPSGAPAFPWPQCLQERKHAKGGGAMWNTLTGLLREPDATGEQHRVQTEPLKRSFLAADQSLVRPARAERGKTAIEEGGRRVDSGRYFQYEHLTSGHAWVAWLDGDDSAALHDLANLLVDGVRLGRSKLREFGGEAKVAEIPDWTDPRSGQWKERAERRLVLWCLSDIAIVDHFGTPDLAPIPSSFRLPEFEGQLDAVSSLISTRRFAPYNTWLGTRDREIAVIEAGSVLVYQLDRPLSLAAFRNGVGLWRERGLGVVWPNPPMLVESKTLQVTRCDQRSAGSPAESTQAALPAMWENLLPTLQARADAMVDGRQVTSLAQEITHELKRAIDTASLQGETPGPSQWSQVAAAAARSGTAGKLLQSLFETDKICAGKANQMWCFIAPTLRRRLDPARAAEPRQQRMVLTALQRAARGIARMRSSEERRT